MFHEINSVAATNQRGLILLVECGDRRRHDGMYGFHEKGRFSRSHKPALTPFQINQRPQRHVTRQNKAIRHTDNAPYFEGGQAISYYNCDRQTDI